MITEPEIDWSEMVSAMIGADAENMVAADQAEIFLAEEQWSQRDRHMREHLGLPTYTFNWLSLKTDAAVRQYHHGIPGFSASAADPESYESAAALSSILRTIQTESMSHSVFADAYRQLLVRGHAGWRVELELDSDGNPAMRILPLPPGSHLYVTGNGTSPSFISAAALVADMPYTQFSSTFSDIVDVSSVNLPELGELVNVTEAWYRRGNNVWRAYMLDASSEPILVEQLPVSKIGLIGVFAPEYTVYGKKNRRSLVHRLMPAQSLINTTYSMTAQHLNLALTEPWIAAASAMDGHAVQWIEHSRNPQSVLLYNDRHLDGGVVPPPTKKPYGENVNTHADIINQCLEYITAAFGPSQSANTPESAVGEWGSEVACSAAMLRDTMRTSIQYTGEVILDFIKNGIPDGGVLSGGLNGKYTVARNNFPVMEGEQLINPAAKVHVTATTGQDYISQQKQAFSMLDRIMEKAPGFMQVVGDILVESSQLPQSDEIIRRMRMNMNPKYFSGRPEIASQLTQAENENRQLKEQLQAAQEQIQNLKLKVEGQVYKADTMLRIAKIKEQNAGYRAETDRLSVLEPAIEQGLVNPEILRPLIAEVMMSIMNQIGTGKPVTGTQAAPQAAHTPEISEQIGEADDAYRQ